MSRDAYVSIRHGRARVWGEPEGRDTTVMIDVDPASDCEILRNISPGVLRQRGALWLVRADVSESQRAEHQAGLVQMFKKWELRAGVVLLRQRVGTKPALDSVHGPTPPSSETARILAQARAIELRALLEWGRAIWKPTTYHYRLPSGEHSPEFVKLGDAIREARDAAVLATWLYPYLRDAMGIVVDTGTLLPLAQAAIAAMLREGWSPNPTTVLDQYPATALDVRSAIEIAAGDSSRVLALVSINSSGGVLDRIHRVIHDPSYGLQPMPVQILINKDQSLKRDDLDVWSPLPGEPPLVAAGSRDVACDLCRSPDRARLVPINPMSYDGMLPTQLRFVTPPPATALANDRFWTFADPAVAVQARPHPALASYRSDEVPMGVVVRIEELLCNQPFVSLCCGRFKELHEREGLGRAFDLVLAPYHETQFPGYSEFWDRVRNVVAPDVERPVPYPLDQDFQPALTAQIQGARRILVFCLGVVTGTSLQQGLVGVQTARRDIDAADHELEAIAVHARPGTMREWQTLRNSYGRPDGGSDLYYGWRTIIPDLAPFHEEQQLLQKVDQAALTEPVRAFHTERLRLCSGAAGTDRPPLFWGGRDDDRLTPNSLFGQALSARATYAAVGATLVEARVASKDSPSPELRVFELAAMVRSYYDPLILASFLRWLRPHEAWWGWQSAEGVTTVTHMLQRKPEQRRILVPELLLAAALGKLTKPVYDAVVGYAEKLRLGAGGDARLCATVDLATMLAATATLPEAPRDRV
jgi:hypothetical protein